MWKFVIPAFASVIFASQISLAREKASADKSASALAFKVQSLEGKDVDLSKYKGKVVLIVNVASKCGLTPQYKARRGALREVR